MGMLSNRAGNARNNGFGRFCARLFLKPNSPDIFEALVAGGENN
jgi:hypothetical protein